MTASILVATPHPPFGELLRISLEESGQYQVRLVQSAREARAASGRIPFQLAILDTSLTDQPFVPLCTDLLRQQPGLRLVVIPPENNPNHPSLGGLMPHGYLSRPFYLPDLIATVSRLLGERDRELHSGGETGPSPDTSLSLPPWLQEPLTLTAYLKKEIAPTAAQAGIIGLNDPALRSGTVRAWTGDIAEEAAVELAGAVFRYWDRGEKTDLMRYLRLATNKKDYLVYAAQISGDLVLILAFDTGAPLSQIRPQTRQVAHTLATVAPEGFDTGTSSSSAATTPEAAPEAQVPPATSVSPEFPVPLVPTTPEPVPAATPAQHEPHTQPSHAEERHPHLAERNAPAHERPPAARPEEMPGLEEEEAELEGELINLASLLGEIPSPDPAPEKPTSRDSGWQPERASLDHNPTLPGWMNGWEHVSDPIPDAATSNPITPDAVTPDSVTEAENNEPPAPPSAPNTDDTQRLPGRGNARPPAADETARVDVAARRPVEFVMPPATQTPPAVPPQVPGVPPAAGPQANFSILEPPPDSLEDTRPGVISTINQLTQLEAAQPSLSLLHYTCVLVPRMPGHYLTGELADRLSQWVAQLCLAFGWRLEGIAVRPEYLQWSVQVAPAVSPGNVVRILRQRTSQNIFHTYAGLADDNPSGDFWASGYLIVSGPQPPSAQLLRDYILRTRKRQGLVK